MGAFAIAGLMVVTRLNQKSVPVIDAPVTFSRVQAIIANRCVTCHSAKPSDPMFPAPPAGVMLDTPQQIKMMASGIYLRSVEQQNMPFNNRTGMTLAERGELARRYRDGARIVDGPVETSR